MALMTLVGSMFLSMTIFLVLLEYENDESKKYQILRFVSVIFGAIIALVGIFAALQTGALLED